MKSLRIWNSILLTVFALVWLLNGLYCKILNLVPRHQEIVAEILGQTYSRQLTIAIGIGEVLIAIWIISRKFKNLCAITQIALIISMNILEFILASNLLLWGRLNILFALSFAALICYQAFVLQPKLERYSNAS